MSDGAYSEINLHITWHTKNSLPMITEKIEDRLYRFLTHKILETPRSGFMRSEESRHQALEVDSYADLLS